MTHSSWEHLEAKKPTRFNVDYWLAKSALHWSEGRLQDANQSWEKADALAQQLPRAGAYDFDRHCCSLLRHALDDVPVSTSNWKDLRKQVFHFTRSTISPFPFP